MQTLTRQESWGKFNRIRFAAGSGSKAGYALRAYRIVLEKIQAWKVNPLEENEQDLVHFQTESLLPESVSVRELSCKREARILPLSPIL